MKRIITILAAMLPALAPAKDKMAPVWPDLKSVACVSGRPATKDDVAAGRAVFVLQDHGAPIGEAMKIEVPQYAYHLEADTKERTPCVIIQAEQARGQKLIGCKLLEKGGMMAGLFSEFVLMGDKVPSSQ